MSMATKQVRLVLSDDAWQQFKLLLLDAGRVGVADVRWRQSGDGEEALVDRLQLLSELPRGQNRPPLDDYLVIAVRHDNETTALDLAARVEPRLSQILAVLVLDAKSPDRWEGLICRDGVASEIAGFQVAGAGMLRVERGQASDLQNSQDALRFSRLRGAVGEAVFRKLRRAAVTLVGCSRNGTLAAQMFSALGVRQLRLVDPQDLQIENLDGMPGVEYTAIGQPKTHALAASLLANNPDLAVSCSEYSVLDMNSAPLFQTPTDLLVTCVDDDAARVLVGIRASRMLVPHLDLATSVQQSPDGRRIFGDVRLFLPGQGCCACVPRLTDAEREQILYAINAPQGYLMRGESQEWFEERAGSLITINAATVSCGLAAWLDLLAGDQRVSCWQRLDWVGGSGLRAAGTTVAANEDCAYCSWAL